MFNHLYWPEFRKNLWNLVLNEQLFIKLYFCQNEYFINDEFKGVTPNFSKWIDLPSSRDFHPHLRRRLHHQRWLSILFGPTAHCRLVYLTKSKLNFAIFAFENFAFWNFFEISLSTFIFSPLSGDECDQVRKLNYHVSDYFAYA